MAEVRSLGEQFSGVAINLKRMEKRRCPHHKPISAADCLTEIIGEPFYI